MSGHRLPVPLGSRLDRSQVLSFRFDGAPYRGYRGDTLASALIAEGVTLFARSFKLHRPRGVYTAGIEEPNALVDVGEGARHTPNVRATDVELREGLVARSVNRWPSLALDLRSINGWFSRVLPAGFYYKTFKFPEWHWFEPAIRRAAGLGRAPALPDADDYGEVSSAVDVAVVGSGPAGLAAAAAAGEAGAKVMLIAAGAAPGAGARDAGDPEIYALKARCERAGVAVLTRTLAFGIYDHNLIAARERLDARERLWKIRARRIVLATGALERPLVFPGNDRPGVMLARAADRYAHAYGVACGRRAVIAANGDHAYAIAGRLRRAGLEIAAVVDCRAAGALGAGWEDEVGDAWHGVDSALVRVHGARGVRACTVATGRGERRIDCDLILSAGAPVPTVNLHSQAGGRLRWLEAEAMFVPDGAPQGIVSVGACAGVFERAAALTHAAACGESAARGTQAPDAPVGGAGRARADTCVPGARGKQFVDLQNDVTAFDIALAARENYRSVEHLKRYTTLGMGTDQGKTSNVNALVLMGVHTGRAPAAVGTTKFRPPYAPVSLGLIAGHRVGARYRPLKRLPAESWHTARGALFEEYGGWRRPAAYPRDGETLEAAALREARAVRNAVGLFDGTPLGKLEIFGPDAGRFLDHMYLGTLSTLEIGRARYGLVLSETGVVVDDGIVARLGEQRFWVNTTSGGAERTAAAFEEWLQCEFVDYEVAVTPVTSRWMNVTVAGPRAFEWLRLAGLTTELAPDRMRHMSILDTDFAGTRLRVLRASFSGEIGYEINVPVDEGQRLIDRLASFAPQVEAAPYGIEALQILRIEKGYIHIGTDTDGTTLPQDIGFGRGSGGKAANFVGRRSLERPVARDPDRLQLVALEPVDGATLLPVGAQIARERPPTRSEGHVTSSVMSAALGRPIALAMLARGASRQGEIVRLHHLGRTLEARVTRAPFFDPDGARLRG